MKQGNFKESIAKQPPVWLDMIDGHQVHLPVNTSGKLWPIKNINSSRWALWYAAPPWIHLGKYD